MRIAVVQHRLRPTPAQDLEALVIALTAAAADGADAAILPEVTSLHEGPLGEDLFRRIAEDCPGLATFVAHADACGSLQVLDVFPFGRTVLLAGDAALEMPALHAARAADPLLAVLAPGSESELQAQAVLEFAVGLSLSLASVVVIAESDGAEVGEPGHGGSAIVYLGEVIAEAVSGDDVLLADLVMPLVRPEPPGTLPEIPPVLAQRAAAHEGRKLEVDYPADLG